MTVAAVPVRQSPPFRPAAIYAERGVERYELGRELLERHADVPLHWVDAHHLIPELREAPDTEFTRMKRLLHRGRTCVRFSINPPELVRQVEIGTAPLRDRLRAARRLLAARYPVGLIVAPIMLVADWQEQYSELFDIMQQELEPDEHRAVTFELIFMTYGRANAQINAASMPGVRDVFEPDKMRPKGPAKLSYKQDVRTEAEPWFQRELAARFPETEVLYIV